jgi:hypothetical protein
MITFLAAAKNVRIYTLGVPDVIDRTLSKSCGSSLSEVFNPTLITIGEAARAVKVDHLMPLVLYQ